jgi:hypothetical protein
MQTIEAKCMKCGSIKVLEVDEKKPLGEQLGTCNCGSKSWFIRPVTEIKEEKGEVATIQVFLTKDEYDYLTNLLKRKMRGITSVLRNEERLMKKGKIQMIDRAKKSNRIVQLLLDKLLSLRGSVE